MVTYFELWWPQCTPTGISVACLGFFFSLRALIESRCWAPPIVSVRLHLRWLLFFLFPSYVFRPSALCRALIIWLSSILLPVNHRDVCFILALVIFRLYWLFFFLLTSFLLSPRCVFQARLNLSAELCSFLWAQVHFHLVIKHQMLNARSFCTPFSHSSIEVGIFVTPHNGPQICVQDPNSAVQVDQKA